MWQNIWLKQSEFRVEEIIGDSMRYRPLRRKTWQLVPLNTLTRRQTERQKDRQTYTHTHEYRCSAVLSLFIPVWSPSPSDVPCIIRMGLLSSETAAHSKIWLLNIIHLTKKIGSQRCCLWDFLNMPCSWDFLHPLPFPALSSHRSQTRTVSWPPRPVLFSFFCCCCCYFM